MIRTKAYLIREIKNLKKKQAKLVEEVKTLETVNKHNLGLKKTVPLVTKEIESISSKIEALYWCANTSEKQLPKIKKKKKKVRKINTNKDKKDD